MFSTNSITDKIELNKITRSTQGKENFRHEYTAQRQKTIQHTANNVNNNNNMPRLGQSRAGIKCKKPQPTKDITSVMNKSGEIPKIPMAQNAPKIKWTFPCMNNQ